MKLVRDRAVSSTRRVRPTNLASYEPYAVPPIAQPEKLPLHWPVRGRRGQPNGEAEAIDLASAERRSVTDGLSPNSFRKATENRPNSQNP